MDEKAGRRQADAAWKIHEIDGGSLTFEFGVVGRILQHDDRRLFPAVDRDVAVGAATGATTASAGSEVVGRVFHVGARDQGPWADSRRAVHIEVPPIAQYDTAPYGRALLVGRVHGQGAGLDRHAQPAGRGVMIDQVDARAVQPMKHVARVLCLGSTHTAQKQSAVRLLSAGDADAAAADPAGRGRSVRPCR